MKHHVERASPKGPGQQFIGTCRLCGKPNLPASAALEDCENVRAIRYLWKVRRPGVNRQQDIAKIYGVSQRTVSLIVRGETWKEGAGK